MRSDGSIIKTKEGSYRAYYVANGKRVSKRFSNARDAADWLARAKTEVADGVFVEPSTITLGDWWDNYVKTYIVPNRKPRTALNYRTARNHFEGLLNIPLQKLNAVAIQQAINNIPSVSGKYHIGKTLDGILKQAVKLRILKINPFEGVILPRYKAKEAEIFSREELSAIRSVLPRFPLGNFFLLAMATGCRIGELMGLKIQSVHEDSIRIENNISLGEDNSPKSSSSIRTVNVPPAIIQAIKQDWCKPPLSSYVFHTPTGNHLYPQRIAYEWHAILAAAGVPYKKFHTLRHTHATLMLQHLNYIEVSKRLGHSKPSITLDKYCHLMENHKARELDAVNSILQ